MEIFLQILANTIMLGFIYVIVALGLSIIFGVLNIVNFAHGGLLILGCYLTYVFTQIFNGLNYLSVILAMLVIMILGVMLNYFYFRFIPDEDANRKILALIGFNLILENSLLMIFGPAPVSLSSTANFISFGTVEVNTKYLNAASFAIVLVVLTFLLLYKTSLGAKIRAVADNKTAAGIVGINVSKIYFIALSIGFILTGAAGGVISTYYTFSPTAGASFIVIAFTAVILGGLGNLTGTIIGAFIVSAIQNFTSMYISSGLEFVMLFLVFMLIVVVRPQGIMGGRA